MFKCSTLAASITGLALGLATSAAFADDKPVYGVLMKTLSNPFWGAMEKGVDEGGKNAGVEIFLDAVESDQAAEPQLNACNTMLQKKTAAMISKASARRSNSSSTALIGRPRFSPSPTFAPWPRSRPRGVSASKSPATCRLSASMTSTGCRR